MLTVRIEDIINAMVDSRLERRDDEQRRWEDLQDSNRRLLQQSYIGYEYDLD